MSKHAKFLRFPVGPVIGLFEIVEWKQPFDVEATFTCQCCGKELKTGMDICQWGMFEDSYTTYLICHDCGKAYEFTYAVPTYTIFSKREQKSMGFSFKASGKPTITDKVGEK